MKTYILLFVCLIFGCKSKGIISKSFAKKTVYLFAGQSNMDGRADGSLIMPADLARLDKVANRITFYYNGTTETPLQLTTPARHIQKKYDLVKSFGPELFFGIEMAEKYPDREFIFIKRALGGSSLYGCWNPDWDIEKARLMNEENRPRLYEELIDNTLSVLSNYNPNEYQVAGMLWVQGETDSAIKRWGDTPARKYGSILQNLIIKTRINLSAPNMPFVIFQVGNGMVVKGMTHVAQNDKDTYLISQSNDKSSNDFYPKNPPPIGHYTAESMKRIGVAFFNILK